MIKNDIKHSKLTVVVTAISLFVLSFLVYLPALKSSFVWDDTQYIINNGIIRSLSIHSLFRMFTTFHEGHWHPLTWISHAVDFAVWNLNPLGHHLTNIVLHGLNSSVMFLAIHKLIIKAKILNNVKPSSQVFTFDKKQALIIAGISAALFALHPLQVETVVWVSERKGLLSNFFIFASILAYLSYTSSINTKRSRVWFITTLFLFILALMSKPMAMTFPAILLLIDIYPLKRLIPKTAKTYPVLWEKIPFFFLSIISGLITIMAQHAQRGIITLEKIPLDYRLLNAIWSIIFYLKKTLFPFELVPVYPLPTSINWLDLTYLTTEILFFIIFTICIFRFLNGKHFLIIVWVFFLITLFPVLGIVQPGGQSAKDHYFYLPGSSVFILMGTAFYWILSKSLLIKQKVFPAVLALIIICYFGFLGLSTFKQISVWQNPKIFWTNIINKFPNKVPFAYSNLGNYYNNLNMLDKAVLEYKKALKINPEHAFAHYNLANVYNKQSKWEQAIQHFTKAININKIYVDAINNLGIAHIKIGQTNKAIEQFKKALSIKPNDLDILINLGYAYKRNKMMDSAILEFQKVLAINPNIAKAHFSLSSAYYEQQEFESALFHCQKAIDLGFSVPEQFKRKLYNQLLE